MNDKDEEPSLEKFEELLGGLLCVPKSELDEALEAERAERKPREPSEDDEATE
jgi:hypothetical protein